MYFLLGFGHLLAQHIPAPYTKQHIFQFPFSAAKVYYLCQEFPFVIFDGSPCMEMDVGPLLFAIYLFLYILAKTVL